MCHETCSRTEDRKVATTLLHQLELICFDRLANLVVGNLEVGHLWHYRRVFDSGDLLISPVVQRLRRRRVMPMAVDNHRALPFVIWSSRTCAVKAHARATSITGA